MKTQKDGGIKDVLGGQRAYEESAEQIPAEKSTVVHIQPQANNGEI